MPKVMAHGRIYWAIVLSLSLFNFLIVLVFYPSEFKGPDTRKFLELSTKAQEWSFWVSPDAFDGNYWGVGYPTFLALMSQISGGNTIAAAEIFQAAMVASLVLFTAVSTVRSGKAISLVSALISAVSPVSFYLAWNGGYEVLLAFSLGISIVLIWVTLNCSPSDKASTGWILSSIAGFAFGFAFMTQNKVVILLPVFLFVLWRSNRKNFSWFLLFAALLPLLWSLRNLMVMNSISPFSNNAEINVWIGNNSKSIAGQFMEPPPLPDGLLTYRDAAVSFVINQPEATVVLFLRKIASLLQPVFIYPEVQLPPGGSTVLHFSTALLSLAILAGVFLYVFALIWNSEYISNRDWWLAVLYFAFVLVNLPFIAEARFRTPLEWLAIAIAVPTFVELIRVNWARWRR
jgi:hypothetical protein